MSQPAKKTETESRPTRARGRRAFHAKAAPTVAAARYVEGTSSGWAAASAPSEGESTAGRLAQNATSMPRAVVVTGALRVPPKAIISPPPTSPTRPAVSATLATVGRRSGRHRYRAPVDGVGAAHGAAGALELGELRVGGHSGAREDGHADHPEAGDGDPRRAHCWRRMRGSTHGCGRGHDDDRRLQAARELDGDGLGLAGADRCPAHDGWTGAGGAAHPRR